MTRSSIPMSIQRPSHVLWLYALVPLGASVRITRLQTDQTFDFPMLDTFENRSAVTVVMQHLPAAFAHLGRGTGLLSTGTHVAGLQDWRLALRQHWALLGLAQAVPTRAGAGPAAGLAAGAGGSAGVEPPFLEHLGQVLAAVGGGTGVSLRAADPSARREHDRRAHFQNDALAALMVAAYFLVLFVGGSYLRWKVEVPSDVSYYSCQSEAAVEGHDAVGFLTAFNQTPRHVRLQVAGYQPEGAEEGACGHLAFNFALDLTPWVVREDWATGTRCLTESADSTPTPAPLFAGLEAAELEKLQEFLEKDKNDLACVVLCKHVSWPDWEDVATNIRQRIKQSGFDGDVVVHCDNVESVTIHKNRPWANFMNHRSMPLLCMLSLVGWPCYMMYMAWRKVNFPVHAHFRVDIAIEEYWGLISDKLCATGFDASGGTGGSSS